MGLLDFLKRSGKNAETPSTPAANQTAASGSSAAAGEEWAVGSLLGEGGANLSDLLGRLSAGGLDDVVKSWIGMGENKGVGADQIRAVFSSEEIWVVAGKLGVNEEVAADKIATILPGIVDKLTPDGLIPDPDSVADKLAGLLKGKLG